MLDPNRIRLTVILGFLAVAIALFVIDSTGNMGNLLNFLRNPMATLASWSAEPAQTIQDQISAPDDLESAQNRIAELESQLAILERENEELRELQGEYQVLVSLFDYAVETPENQRVMARVIGRDTSPLFKSIIIDKGTEDGVFIGMPVDSERGLVGQVFRTTANSAMVLLITDSSSSIPVRLSESRTVGVLHGGGLGGDLRIDWIPLEDQIAVGDVVITSGLVGEFEQGMQVSRFPKGLIVGRVSDVERSEAEILQRAVIQSAVDFEGLEFVFVITEFPRNDLSGFEDPLGENETDGN